MGSVARTLTKDYSWNGCALGTPMELGCSPKKHTIKKGTTLTGFPKCVETMYFDKPIVKYYHVVQGRSIPNEYFAPTIENGQFVPAQTGSTDNYGVKHPDSKSPDPKKLILLVLLAIGVVFLYKKLITE
jgi:hypothetical protein